MASIFKRGRRGAWIIQWFDHRGRRRERSSRTTDRRAAERIAAKLEEEAALAREGVIDPRLQRVAEADRIPLRKHVDAYIAFCQDAGQAAFTVSEKKRHLEWMLEVTGWPRLSALNAEGFQHALALLRDRGRSARTLNFKREVALAFARWCLKTGRLASNPLSLVKRADEERDRRHFRRALKDEELARLLNVAEARGRKLWYMLAVYAGLRRREIAELLWGDVDLDGGTISISRGKAKRLDVIPLHPDLVEELARVRPALALPKARVFETAVTNQTRRRDFERAGISPADESGAVADLHALRTTLGTRLARAGVAPQITQRLMRHSDYRLTQKHYTRLTLQDDAGAIAMLPQLPTEERKSTVRATGTAGEIASKDPQQIPQQSAHETVRDRAKTCEKRPTGGSALDARKLKRRASLRENLRPLAMAHPEGLEPPALGSEDRCSIR